MEAATEIKRNRLPVRTWNRLGMNESILEEEDAKRLRSAEQEEPVVLSAARGNGTKAAFALCAEKGKIKCRRQNFARRKKAL